MNLILIGPAGSGKGTQAELLVQEYQLAAIEVGGLLRKTAQEQTERGRLINDLINRKGELLPDGITFEIVEEYIKGINWQNGLLFDGYPRSVKQFEMLEDYLVNRNQFLHLGIHLEITEQTAIERLGDRRICQNCGRIYNTVTLKSIEIDKCNDCGGKLIRRPDDHPEAIKLRLKMYQETTQPVLTLMRSKGILAQIDASKPITEVFADIKQALIQKGLVKA